MKYICLSAATADVALDDQANRANKSPEWDTTPSTNCELGAATGESF